MNEIQRVPRALFESVIAKKGIFVQNLQNRPFQWYNMCTIDFFESLSNFPLIPAKNTTQINKIHYI